jgi:glycerate dehydrogenase
MMKIVVLDGNTLNPGDNPWTGLEPLGDLEVYGTTDPDKVVERGGDADILVINKIILSPEVLDKLPNLKFVAVTATGYNVVDLEATRARGISVSNIPTYGTPSVAQFVFALLLELCHHVSLHDKLVKQGDWTRCPDFCFWNTPQIELMGKTMGILGFGRIGQNTGRIADALGMRVIAHEVFEAHAPDYDGFEFVSQDELFEQSDVISMHCPLTPENTGIINSVNLERMKTNAFLINTARGPLVVEQDLADALNNDVIAGAGLDVVQVEPMLEGNPLLQAKNCIITPHIAWATLSARSRLMGTVVDNVAAFQKGSPQNVVN